MSELLNKSKLNLEAADLLISRNNFAPSIHCSYYSFIQTALYILSGYGINNQTQHNSHEIIRNNLFKLLEAKHKLDSIYFNRDFNRIKKMRIRSDYFDLGIEEKDASMVNTTSKELSKLILKLDEN